MTGSHNKNINYKILLYVPNIIGYIRGVLLVIAASLVNYPVWFILIYSISIFLDGIDGYAARKLKETSLFGAWLDVVIDNIGRGLLWTSIHPYFYLISALEWIAFVCNHQLGEKWREKIGMQVNQKSIVVKIFQNNFKSVWGTWAVSGIHVLPIWVYGYQRNVFNDYLDFLPYGFPILGLVVLSVGRSLCLIAESQSIWAHIQLLLKEHPSDH